MSDEHTETILNWADPKKYDPLIVRKLRPNFTSQQIEEILEAILSTCRDCLDADDGCYCGSGWDL